MDITLRNLSEELVAKLRALAKQARRSLNSEILYRLEVGVQDMQEDEAMSLEAQKSRMQALAGSWRDNRSTEEIIEDIYRHRTLGREIEL